MIHGPSTSGHSSAKKQIAAGRILYWGACAIVVAYGGLLRLDAFVGKYGTLDHPAWARALTHDVASVASTLKPSSIAWTREQRPYVGGDPIGYLAFAREMRSFYQPHVREPVFLATTKAGLWLLAGQDAGISLASAAGSMLTIVGLYLLGSVLASRAVGLLAALLGAIEIEAVGWAPDGWRDDTFTATVLFAAWSLLRLRQRPDFRNALLAGLFCGLACLTRITAVSFVLPALLWIVIDGDSVERRRRLQQAATALLMASLLVGPYLISCALATGDPLIAINYHTRYYRFSEGLPSDAPMSAAEYLRVKLASRPLATIDTAFNGLFVQPFDTKWHGFEHWASGMGAVLKWLALAGLAVTPFFAAGRLLLVILLASLVPYVFTWNVAGGGEWRFTMHAYSFYLVCAALAVVGAGRLAAGLVQRTVQIRRAALARLAVRGTAVLALVGVGTAVYFGLPWLVVREGIAKGESTSVEVGERDRVFFGDGWSEPHTDGITVRVSTSQRSVVRVPLATRRGYELVLRMDPVLPDAQDRVSVLFNGILIGRLRLTWDPQRVGSYRLRIPEEAVRAGTNRLMVVPETLVRASLAGPRFAWLDPADSIGIRLWYVRVLP